MLYVTHDQTEAMTMATRIGILDRGRLVQVGTPHEIYERPINAYVAARLGSPAINLLPIEALPATGAPKGAVSVGARTEHVELIPADDGPAEVVMVEHLGSENFLHLRMNGQRLVTLTPPGSQWRPGRRARLSLHHPLYFDAAGCTLTAAHHGGL